MKSNKLTQIPLARLCFVILVIIFNIYFGIIIFEHWAVEDGIVGRVFGTLMILIILQGSMLLISVVISDIWKWIWEYEV